MSFIFGLLFSVCLTTVVNALSIVFGIQIRHNMAFLSKIGRIFRQTSAHVTASNSMLQSIRCMSSSKIFVGGDYNSISVVGEIKVFSFFLVLFSDYRRGIYTN